MPLEQYSEKQLTSFANHLEKVREYKEGLIVLNTGKDSPFWKALKKNLNNVIEGNKFKIREILGNRIEQGDMPELTRLYAAVVIAEDIIEQVENADNCISTTNSKIIEIREKIKEMKESIGNEEK